MPERARKRSPGLLAFLKSTLLGGVLFLLPLALVLFLLGHVYVLAKEMLGPVVESMTPDRDRRIVVLALMAVGALVGTAFLAGLFARTLAGQRVLDMIETRFMDKFPQYRTMKYMGENLAQLETSHDITPVLARSGNGWQIGYAGKELKRGWFTVFLPEAPNPLSGTIAYLPAGDVKQLNITLAEAMALVRRMGIGSDEALKGVDL